MAQRQFRTTDTEEWKPGFGNKTHDIVVDTNSVLQNEYAAFGGSEGTTPEIDAFDNGDILVIHRSRGTDANVGPTWELNRKKDGDLEFELTRDFLNDVGVSDPNRSQAVKAVVCKNFTLTSGATLTIMPWDQYKGGLGVIIADTVDLSGGILDLRNSGFMAGLTGGDYSGGRGENWADHALSPYGNYPSSGDPSADTDAGRLAKGNAGGAAAGNNSANDTQPGAGGAANKNNGSNGNPGNASSNVNRYGRGGVAAGNDDLSALVFSGAGSVGAGTTNGGWHPSKAAGTGTASLIIICRKFKAPSRIIADGSDAAPHNHIYQGGSSGSAGANVLIQGIEIDLGTNKITAQPGVSRLRAGSSSVGRIAARYSRSIAGMTSPSATVTEDTIYDKYAAIQGSAAILPAYFN